MKLTKNKKLDVFFGGFIIENISKAVESDDNWIFKTDYERVSCKNERDEKIKNRILNERRKIVENLNKNRAVLNVSDLFVNLPPEQIFNPILFQIHLPFSLQSMGYVGSEYPRAQVEDFFIVYDGFLVIIYTLCDFETFPYGIWDARDRVVEIFNEFGEVKIAPPTLSPRHVTFIVNNEKQPSKTESSIVIPVKKIIEVKKILRELYSNIDYPLSRFYEASLLARDLFLKSVTIEQCNIKMLNNLTELLELNGLHLIKKWKTVNKIKKDMGRVIKEIGQYRSDAILLKQFREDIKGHLIDNKSLSSDVLELLFWDSYTTTKSTLDIDSVFKSVEHVRREIENYSLNTSTIFSALIGAITGSIITLIISTFS